MTVERTLTAKPCVAAPAALLARTITGAAARAVSVAMVTRPEPASMPTPAGAASSAKPSASPRNAAWAETVRGPLSCSRIWSGMPPTATGAASGAATVTRKPVVALPPELLAVTVTGTSATSASVGMATTPVRGSTLAPAPLTAKRSASPAKAAAASTERVPFPLRARGR